MTLLHPPQVFRLLRSLRPLRVINRAPGLKLVVQTLLSSLKPIGNIVLICMTFFVIFGILGVQVGCFGEDEPVWNEKLPISIVSSKQVMRFQGHSK